MAFQVTQCPSCESTFNTNPNLLDMAEGKVRCGACLTVFLAQDNFVDTRIDDAEDEQESVFIGSDPNDFFDPSLFLTRSALSEGTQEISVHAGTDDIHLDDHDTEAHNLLTDEITPAQLESFLLPTAASSAVPDQPEPESFTQEHEQDLTQSAQQIPQEMPEQHLEFFAAIDASLEEFETHQVDEDSLENFEPHLAEEVSEEIFETPQAQEESQQIFATRQAEEETLEELVRQAIDEQDFTAAIASGLQEPPAQEPAVTNTAEEAAEADEVHDIGELTQAPEQEEEEAAPPAAEEVLGDAAQDVDTSTEAIRARALRQHLEDEEALEQIPQENLAGLKRIATPVELLSGRQSSWGKRFALFSLSLVFAATLAGQYLWRYQDLYSVDPRFRSGYEIVCAQLACELPEFSAIDAIRSDNLAVRSHPEREDGLMVTVEIRNTAEFPQRFPVLILGFNSASNQVIALREFSPEEYLESGLQQIEFMPVSSPVQIAIPIMDPGNDAVNYTLAFRSP